MTEFCLESSYFQFRSTYYIQTEGTAMGSCLSPILAELVVDTLITTVIGKLDFEIPYMRKFVDDLLLALPEGKTQTTLDAFNAYHPMLQFTMEVENQNQIPYLDTLVIRNADQTISTQWYAKSIASGRLLNFHSHHPTRMKLNVAYNFMKRVTQLTTNQTVKQCKEIIFQHLKSNDYPSKLINGMFKQLNIIQPTISQHHIAASNKQPQQHQQSSSPTRDNIAAPNTLKHQQQPNQKSPPTIHHHIAASNAPQSPQSLPKNHQQQHNSSPSASHQPQTPTSIQQHSHNITGEPASSNTTSEGPQSGSTSNFSYRTLTYIPTLTSRIVRDLKKDFPAIKIAQKTINCVGKLYPIVKDPILPAQQSNIVYNIPCRDCEKVYIGMSTNTLTKRLYGHKSDVNRYEKVLESGVTSTTDIKLRLGDTTAMVDHIINTEHRFEHTRTRIVDRAKYSSTLRVLEMCHITNTDNTVNYRTDTAKLNTTYTGILQSVRTTSKFSNSNSSKPQNPHTAKNQSNQLPLITSDSPASNPIHIFHTIDSITQNDSYSAPSQIG